MPFPLLALIPALASLFSSGAAGAAAAGTAGAATAGAGAAGGAAAGGGGGLMGLLGGLLGSSGGASGGGGLAGLFGGGAAAAGPEQLSGPGMEGVMGAVGQGGGHDAAAGGGGGGLAGLLGGGGNGGGMLQNILGMDPMAQMGKMYNQGAMAGKGDFRGIEAMLARQTAQADQSRRTNLLEQHGQREGEKFEFEKKGMEDKLKVADQMQALFSKPGAFDNLAETMGQALPLMLRVGDHAGAGKVLDVLREAGKDKNTQLGLDTVGMLAKRHRDPKTGVLDVTKFEADVEAYGNKYVSEAAKAMLDRADKERLQRTSDANVANQQKLEENRLRVDADRDRAFNETTRMHNATLGAMNRRMDQTDENTRLRDEIARRPTTTSAAKLAGYQTAAGLVDRFGDAHENLMKETGGKLSQVMKGVLAKNSTALTFADLMIGDNKGFSDAERKYAAENNNIVGNLRNLTNETALSESDAVRNFQSFNPAATGAQVKANLKARRTSYEKQYENERGAIENTGRDVSKFAPHIRREAATTPKQEEIEAAKKRLGIK